MLPEAIVSRRGADRWRAGHPWIFRSDVAAVPDAPAGAVNVRDTRGHTIGCALWSPTSQISLRMVDRDARDSLDDNWWHERIAAAVARRSALPQETNAYRVVHAEADGLPSLVCDRYGDWLVLQLLSAGLEQHRSSIVSALRQALNPSGILARNDVSARDREGLPRTVELLHGDVPREIEVNEGAVRFLAAPWDGQKTGAYLDQRENRMLAGRIARGRALDCFSYHGSFALHLARGAESVTAVDSSEPALQRAARNFSLNNATSIRTVKANVLDYLTEAGARGEQFDTIVLDPPAFAKSRGAVAPAIRGYRDINLRALKLLSASGVLLTASCSYHISRATFMELLADAVADSGRRVALQAMLGQSRDHPEVIGIPETGYLKGALLRIIE